MNTTIVTKHPLYSEFLGTLESEYPETAALSDTFEILPTLISPFVVDIDIDILSQIEAFRKAFYELQASTAFQKTALENSPWADSPTNSSALTCFDFHYAPEMGLKLIEVNTNASLLLPFRCLRKLHDLPNLPSFDFTNYENDFWSSYRNVFGKAPTEMLIIDEDPQNEGLYFEFLMCQEFFKKRGLKTSILPMAAMEAQAWSQQLVYNRSTDFYFRQPNAVRLKQAYLDAQIAVTPNPRGYTLMADKNQLVALKAGIESLNPELSGIIGESRPFSSFESLDALWQERKNYFFKPQNSFGGKGAFAGKSVSKKMFLSLSPEDYLAQELAPPERRVFEIDGNAIEMKVDLRIYVTENGLIEGGARLYQGQTTNMRTEFGGIAPISLRRP